MKSIHDLIVEAAETERALRANQNSVEGLLPLFEPDQQESEEPTVPEATTDEEIGELDEPEAPEATVVVPEELPDTPEAAAFEPQGEDTPEVAATTLDEPTVGDELPPEFGDIFLPESSEIMLADYSPEAPEQIGSYDDVALPESSNNPPDMATDDFDQPDAPTPGLSDIPSYASAPMSWLESPNIPPERVGFQGFNDLPAVTQQEVELQDLEDPTAEIEDRAERQIEMQMRVSEGLASDLARELGPQFDEMRQTQEQTVRDYVDGQQLLSSLLRPR